MSGGKIHKLQIVRYEMLVHMCNKSKENVKKLP